MNNAIRNHRTSQQVAFQQKERNGLSTGLNSMGLLNPIQIMLTFYTGGVTADLPWSTWFQQTASRSPVLSAIPA